LALAACGDEKKSAPPTEPAAKEEPAAPIEELSSDSPVGFPMDGEEHVPEGELHDAPPLPPEAGK